MFAGGAPPRAAGAPAPPAGPPGEPLAGGGPSGTTAADVMAASANVRCARLSHGVAAAARRRGARHFMSTLQGEKGASRTRLYFDSLLTFADTFTAKTN